MKPDSEIRYFTREEIDTGKWDRLYLEGNQWSDLCACLFTWISWLKTGVL